MTASRPSILVIGDLVDDVVVTPTAPIRPDTDTPATIERRGGGSAANTAAWMAACGARVALVARCAAADVGRHVDELRGAGVEPLLQADPTRPTGTIVIIVEGESRTMLTQRGANEALSPDALTDDLLDRSDVLHATGYSVVDRPGPFARLVERMHGRGGRVALNVGSVGAVADAGVASFAEAVAGVDVLVANLGEGRVLTGLDDADAVAGALAARFPAVAVTLGERGSIVGSSEGLERIEAHPARSVDPTGAGDAFAAGFVTALATGTSLADAGRRGSALAARAVAVVGGRPN